MAPPGNDLSAILSALALSGGGFEPHVQANQRVQSAALQCGQGVARSLSHEQTLRLFRAIQPAVPLHLVAGLSKPELCSLVGDEIVTATVQELCAGRMANQADTVSRLVEVLSVLTGIKRQALLQLSKEELCANIAARLTNAQNFQIINDTGGSPTLMGSTPLDWAQAGEGGAPFLAALAGLGMPQQAPPAPPQNGISPEDLMAFMQMSNPQSANAGGVEALLAAMQQPSAPNKQKQAENPAALLAAMQQSPSMPAAIRQQPSAAGPGILGQAMSAVPGLLKDIGASAASMPFQEFTRSNDSNVLRALRMAGGLFGLSGEDRKRFLQQNWGALNNLFGGKDAGFMKSLFGTLMEAGVNKDKSALGQLWGMIPGGVKSAGGSLLKLGASAGANFLMPGSGAVLGHVLGQEKVVSGGNPKLRTQAHVARAALITQALSRMHRQDCCRECSDASCRQHCIECMPPPPPPEAPKAKAEPLPRPDGDGIRAQLVTHLGVPVGDVDVADTVHRAGAKKIKRAHITRSHSRKRVTKPAPRKRESVERHCGSFNKRLMLCG
eukprot:jgi/Mesvir1/1495/Mv14478-RA.1